MHSIWQKNKIRQELKEESSLINSVVYDIETFLNTSILIALSEPSGNISSIIRNRNLYAFINNRVDVVDYALGKRVISENNAYSDCKYLYYPINHNRMIPFAFCMMKINDSKIQRIDTGKKIDNDLIPKKITEMLNKLGDYIFENWMGQVPEENKDVLFHCKNLRKEFGTNMGKVVALKDITLKIYANELTVITGSSGSGKTTLLNTLAGIMKPTSGEVYYQNHRIDKYNNTSLKQYLSQTIGYIFQNYNLISELTILENVSLGAYQVDGHLDEKEVLKYVGLGDKIKNFPNQLSGGQQQRACIARALVKKPSVLLCDEPTGALDAKNSVIVLELIKQFIKNDNISVVMITHNPAITLMADRCINMGSGEVIGQYRQPFTANPKDINLR